MSIWSTVGPWDHDLAALDADKSNAAHYSAEGERDVSLAVKTALPFHDNVALRILRDLTNDPNAKPFYANLLLTPEATRELISYLQQAVSQVDGEES